MEVDNLYEELSLWEQLQFSDVDEKKDDGLNWTSFASANEAEGGLLVGNKPFWEIEDFGAKLVDENVSLGYLIDNSSDDDAFADWLDERIDVADIDEMVNSPEFDSVMLDISNDASSILDDIEPIPLTGPSKSDDDTKERALTAKPISEGEKADSFTIGSETVVVSDVAGDGTVVVEVNLVYSEEEDEEVAQSPTSSHALSYVVEGGNSVSSVYSTPFTTPPSSPNCSSHPPSPSIRKSKRSNPYSRPSKSRKSRNETSSDESSDHLPTDRKARKRDQNKTAATRYRSKKRSEYEILSQEELILDDTNKELSAKATQLETEISYLKGLMKEILIAKGVLKK